MLKNSQTTSQPDLNNLKILFEKIRLEHSEKVFKTGSGAKTTSFCSCCDVSWPCKTTILLEQLEQLLTFYNKGEWEMRTNV